MDARVGPPRLVLSAVVDVSTAHCEATAYWSARAALAHGVTQARLHFEHADDGEGVVIGFDPGHEVAPHVGARPITKKSLTTITGSFSVALWWLACVASISRCARAPGADDSVGHAAFAEYVFEIKITPAERASRLHLFVRRGGEGRLVTVDLGDNLAGAVPAVPASPVHME